MKVPGLILGLLLTPVAAQAQGALCTTMEVHQFDFWLGTWEVFDATRPDTRVARSVVTPVAGGCMIQEITSFSDGSAIGSLNYWVPAQSGWRQSSAGLDDMTDLHGTWDGMAMTMDGPWEGLSRSPGPRRRVIYTPLADGEVEKRCDVSDDDGATWRPSCDLIYRRTDG